MSELDEPTEAEQRESLRSALAIMKMSQAGDVYGIAQYVATLNEFEFGSLIGSLGVWSATGVAALAAVHGVSFEDELARIEAALMAAGQDGQ